MNQCVAFVRTTTSGVHQPHAQLIRVAVPQCNIVEANRRILSAQRTARRLGVIERRSVFIRQHQRLAVPL